MTTEISQRMYLKVAGIGLGTLIVLVFGPTISQVLVLLGVALMASSWIVTEYDVMT